MSPTAVPPELLPGGDPNRADLAARVRQILADVDAVHDNACNNGLAPAAVSRDAGVNHQREEPMSDQSSNSPGNKTDDKATDKTGAPTTSSAVDTKFTKPAPEGAAKKTSEVLGEIVWLMSQSPLHKQFFISDLEWLVMTPILLQQFRLFYDQEKPVGVVFWATASEEVEERLKSGTTRMRPQDWKSGDRLWVVEVIAPFGAAEEMVKDLKVKVFAEREVKFLATGAQGREVRVL
jgi:cytolysin-activating lysine-acyltransferase